MNPWIKRRWFEFRSGHGLYLNFALALANFILISYRLLIEQVTQLNSLLPNLWQFALLFIVVYVPLTVLIGHWHRRSQLPTESNIGFMASPLYARLYRIQLQIIQGTAKKEEVEDMMRILRQAEKAGS